MYPRGAIKSFSVSIATDPRYPHSEIFFRCTGILGASRCRENAFPFCFNGPGFASATDFAIYFHAPGAAQISGGSRGGPAARAKKSGAKSREICFFHTLSRRVSSSPSAPGGSKSLAPFRSGPVGPQHTQLREFPKDFFSRARHQGTRVKSRGLFLVSKKCRVIQVGGGSPRSELKR